MMPSPANLSLTVGGQGLDVDEIDKQTRALRGMLEEEMVAERIEAPRRERAAGEKGDPFTIGALILIAFKTGAIGAAVGCFKTILQRQHNLVITVREADGSEVHIDATNVDDDKVLRFMHEAIERRT